MASLDKIEAMMLAISELNLPFSMSLLLVGPYPPRVNQTYTDLSYCCHCSKVFAAIVVCHAAFVRVKSNTSFVLLMFFEIGPCRISYFHCSVSFSIRLGGFWKKILSL
jgi:hypothetical protein